MKLSFFAHLRQFGVLVAFKALAELRADRQRSYLGFLWWFFDPAFFMLVYYFVFAVLLQRGGPHYIPILLIGLVFWRWFSASILNCANSIRSGLSLLRSVPVQATVFPFATLVADSFKFLAVLIVLLIVLVALGYHPNRAWIALPAVLVAELPWVFGVSMIVAAVVPFVPDLRFIVGHALQALFYLSAIFFSLSSIPAQWRGLLEYDPLAVIVDCARQILVHAQFPDFIRLGRMMIAGIVVLVIGVVLLNRASGRYPKLAN